jgi:hypothetical protein
MDRHRPNSSVIDRIKPDSHGTIIDQLDFHRRTESSTSDGCETLVAQLRCELVAERLSDLWSRSCSKRRPPAFAYVSKERELTDDQHPASDIEHRAIKTTISTREEPQIDDFRRQPGCVVDSIGTRDTQQQQISVGNRAYGFACNPHFSTTHTLQ